MRGVISVLAAHALLIVSAAPLAPQQSSGGGAGSANISTPLIEVGIPRQQRADTVIRVSRGARLEISGRMTSDLVINTWDRDEVSVVTGSPVQVTTTGELVRLEAANGRAGRGRGSGQSAYQVTVPRWMPINVPNARGDVTVEGSEADVNVESQTGSVRVIGGRGQVSAHSTSGSVRVENVQGNVTAYSVSQSVRIIGVTGNVRAESTNGSITLERVDTRNLVASTTNGNIDFDGPIQNDGVYRLTTHNGRVSMVIAENANATVTVSSFNGRYSASFPIQVTGMGPDRRMRFTVGNGSARVEASSFNGNIAFRRPGQPRPAA